MRAGAERAAGPGSVRTVQAVQSLATNAISLITTGAGLFIGWSATTSATTGADVYMTAYDASATGTNVYDFSVTGLPSAGSRVLWVSQVQMDNSAGVDVGRAILNPPQPLPFHRGLLVAATTLNSTAAGSTGVNIVAVFQSQK
jgi:hypothetical protein